MNENRFNLSLDAPTMPNIKVGEFRPVSREMYNKIVANDDWEIVTKYDELKMPERATRGSAGYDIYTPINIKLNPGESVLVPTCIKCRIRPNYVLLIMPKSGLGLKYGIQLSNTIGVIDADYYGIEAVGMTNEGHIMIKIVNTGKEIFELEAGSKFCQGIFMPYGITINDNVTSKRNGGLGSTGK